MRHFNNAYAQTIVVKKVLLSLLHHSFLQHCRTCLEIKNFTHLSFTCCLFYFGINHKSGLLLIRPNLNYYSSFEGSSLEGSSFEVSGTSASIDSISGVLSTTPSIFSDTSPSTLSTSLTSSSSSSPITRSIETSLTLSSSLINLTPCAFLPVLEICLM